MAKETVFKGKRRGTCPNCGRKYPLWSMYGPRVVYHNNTHCRPCLRKIEREVKS